MNGLVLGASSGIAQAMLEKQWQGAGAAGSTWLLCTRGGKPVARLVQAAQRYGILLEWHACDALDPTESLLTGLRARNWRPDRVLVAWGVLIVEAEGCESDFMRQHEINCTSTLRWLKAIVSWLGESREPARIAVLGSVAGDRVRRGQWHYSLSKQGLEQGMEALRDSMHPAPADLFMTLVKPGPIATPMTAHMHMPPPLMVRPESIASRVVRAWERGDRVVYAPRWWGWISALLRAVPEPLWRHFPL